MDDLDEREQWERVKQWLREQGPSIVAGIAVAVLALSGWRWWQTHLERRDLTASARYEQVIDAFSHSDFAGGLAIVDGIVRDYPRSAYACQAQLAAARIAVETGQLPQAAERLQYVVGASPDPELALIARLRLARVQISQNRPDAALATLAGANPGAFAALYAETRGDALLVKGDKAGALTAYRAARAAGGGGDDAGTATGSGTGSGTGTADTDLLDLKINELASS